MDVISMMSHYLHRCNHGHVSRWVSMRLLRHVRGRPTCSRSYLWYFPDMNFTERIQKLGGMHHAILNSGTIQKGVEEKARKRCFSLCTISHYKGDKTSSPSSLSRAPAPPSPGKSLFYQSLLALQHSVSGLSPLTLYTILSLVAHHLHYSL